jgi:hypothetical protein
MRLTIHPSSLPPLAPTRGQRPDCHSTREADVKRRGLWHIALIQTRQKRPREAAILFVAVNAAERVTPARNFLAQSQEYAGHFKMIAAVEAALSPDVLQQARRHGAAMTLDEAIDYALQLLDVSVAAAG